MIRSWELESIENALQAEVKGATLYISRMASSDGFIIKILDARNEISVGIRVDGPAFKVHVGRTEDLFYEPFKELKYRLEDEREKKGVDRKTGDKVFAPIVSGWWEDGEPFTSATMDNIHAPAFVPSYKVEVIKPRNNSELDVKKRMRLNNYARY